MDRERVRIKLKGLARKALVTANVVDEYWVPRNGTGLAPYIAARNHVAVHHLIRYQWAAKVLADNPPETLLDVACGAGFGADMLAAALPDTQIIGADYDAKAVARAQSLYERPNLSFITGDVERWDETLGPQSFDTIVSFDTLEHISHRELMLQNVVNHLDRDGQMLFSTPSGSVETNLRPLWEHHHIEYAAPALYDFLSRYFGTVVRPDEGASEHLEVFDQLAGTPITYNLRMNPVICRRPRRITNPYEVETHASATSDHGHDRRRQGAHISGS